MDGGTRIGFILLGLFSFLGAWKDWDWFMYANPARQLVHAFGRKATRIFYLTLGCLFIALGTGIIPTS